MDRRKRYLQRRNQDCIVSLWNSNGGVRRKNQFSFHKREIDSATPQSLLMDFARIKLFFSLASLTKLIFQIVLSATLCTGISLKR